MNDRSQNILAIRPKLENAKLTEQMSAEELFQNQTLRPILKLQNELLLKVFRNYISKRKNAFYELDSLKRVAYITHAVQKDLKFRNSLKGMIIGHFTEIEYERYTANSSALNKRMTQMVIKRLQDQVQVFEKVVSSKAS